MVKSKVGRPGRPPKPASERRDSAIMLRVTAELRQAIDGIAAQHNTSISAIIEEILAEYAGKWRRYTPTLRKNSVFAVVSNLRRALRRVTENASELRVLRQHLGSEHAEKIDADLAFLAELEADLGYLIAFASLGDGAEAPTGSRKKGKGQIDVPSQLVRGGEHYALEVEGDSMVDAGIFDGDTVVIERCDNVENGAIVVALVDDNEVTLKRLRRKGDSIALEPANSDYETRVFEPGRVKIQGRLVGLMRQYSSPPPDPGIGEPVRRYTAVPHDHTLAERVKKDRGGKLKQVLTKMAAPPQSRVRKK